MDPVVHETTIAAPIDAIWAVVADLDRIPAWVEGVASIERAPGQSGGLCVGARFLQRIRQGLWTVECQGEVIACNPPELLELAVRHPSLALRVGYHFRPLDGRTQIRCQMELLETSLPPALVASFIRASAEKLLARQTESLRRLVEAPTRPA